VAVCIGATAVGAARPYWINQNIYLLHAIGGLEPTLQDDWMLSTADSFPLFSAGSRLVYRLGGRPALMFASYVSVAVALAGVYLLALALVGDRPTRRREAILTTLVLATTYGVLSRSSITSDVMPFGGFGAQYLFSGAGFLQPANAGSLVLLALGLRAEVIGRLAVRWATVIPMTLIALTCAIHPGYLLPVMVGVLSIAFASLVTLYNRRVTLEALVTGLVAVTAVAAFSPVARSNFGASSPALDYLAFTRIPHHSLWTAWSQADLFIILLVIAACATSRWLTGAWSTTVALFAALAISVVTAAYVELFRDATVAIAAPWRVSVFLVPISWCIVAVGIIRRFGRAVVVRRLAFLTVTGALALASIDSGVRISAATPNPAVSAAVVAVDEAAPRGTGLIPLHLEDVRLNAGYPIFVDWKSHPHEISDLEEWISRIRRVEDATADEGSFCRLIEEERIGWVLLAVTVPVPVCVSSWDSVESDGVRVLERPGDV
jgi:hypothetical protein